MEQIAGIKNTDLPKLLNQLCFLTRLKHLRITNTNTGIDGEKLSDINLEALNLKSSPFITLRIGIEKGAKNKGGLTIFGEDFGNHPQNILLAIFYSEN